MEKPLPPAARVRLRAATPRDAPLLRQWRSESSVRLFQPLTDLTVGQLRSDVAHQRLPDLYRGRGEKFQWIIETYGDPAGWITLVVSNWEHGLAEVGYALTSRLQNRGVMTRALGILLGELFTRTSLERIEARCALSNVSSQRVLEKNGFVQEGILRSYFKLRGRRVDNYLYAVLKEEWME